MNSKKHIAWNVDYHDMMMCANLFDENCIEEMVASAKEAGIDALFWRVSMCGQMSYRTKAGTPCSSTQRESHRRMVRVLEKFDPLQVARDVCKKYGLVIYTYLSIFDECAFDSNGQVMLQSRFSREHPEFLLRQKDGEPVLGLLCYAYPEAVAYRLAQIEEICDYQTDGVFCEMRSHSGAHRGLLGFNEPIIQAYKDRYDRNPVEEDFSPCRFMRLHGEYLTDLYRKASMVVHAHGQRLLIGVGLGDFHVHGCPDSEELGSLNWRTHSRTFHLDWHRWVEESICDALVVGAGGVDLWNLPWDDIFRRKYLPITKGKAELWAWLRISDWEGDWGRRKPDDAVRLMMRDAAEAQSVDGVTFQEACEWYRPENRFLWEALKTLRVRRQDSKADS